MVTERTLRQWRRDALKAITHPLMEVRGEDLNIAILKEQELNSRILRLTQELLDQYLIRKG